MNVVNPFTPDLVARHLGDRFAIQGILRVGGQGVVYRAQRISARDEQSAGETVALKFYLDSQQNDRVEREIKALEGFFHPNLAKLIEHGQIQEADRAIRYTAWEFIAGNALDHLLSRGALHPRTVACIGRDVARAISHIWMKRIVHRDVNPKNIMLREGEREAVLIDLGVARHLSESTLTSPGITWGTRGYLSPEQCRAEMQLTCQSDVFSLGIVLQEALCGHHPTLGDQSLLVRAPMQTAGLSPAAPAALAVQIDNMLKIRAAFRPSPETIALSFAELAASI